MIGDGVNTHIENQGGHRKGSWWSSKEHLPIQTLKFTIGFVLVSLFNNISTFVGY